MQGELEHFMSSKSSQDSERIDVQPVNCLKIEDNLLSTKAEQQNEQLGNKKKMIPKTADQKYRSRKGSLINQRIKKESKDYDYGKVSNHIIISEKSDTIKYLEPNTLKAAKNYARDAFNESTSVSVALTKNSMSKNKKTHKREKAMRESVYDRLFKTNINSRCMSNIYHSDLNGLLIPEIVKSTIKKENLITNPHVDS